MENVNTESTENQDELKRRALPFVQIENAITEDLDLSIYAKQIYTVLCYFADNNSNECFPKIKTIAKYAGCCERKVPDALKELVDHGYIDKQERKRADDPRVNTSNLYTILVQYEYIKKEKLGVVHEMHQGSAPDARKLYSFNNTSTADEILIDAVLSEQLKESISKATCEKSRLS